MLQNEPQANPTLKLVDIASLVNSSAPLCLQRVGMQGVEMPICLKHMGEKFLLPAKVDIFVSLDDESAKGIHMSRLYRILEQELVHQELELKALLPLLQNLLKSQLNLSKSAELHIHWNQPTIRPALKSGFRGWRHYPVSVGLKYANNEIESSMAFEVLYSSTCPNSAALSRQAIQDKFLSDFEGEEHIAKAELKEWLGEERSMAAVPHAQRSRALIRLKLAAQAVLQPLHWIDLVEGVLKTPVQAAVRREDEQEFARLNAQNLMFCEDATRRIAQSLNGFAEVLDYVIHVEHQESLHPHNAVSQTSKGIVGGW